jgi:flagella basal body P-ring formation protein FlgA
MRMRNRLLIVALAWFAAGGWIYNEGEAPVRAAIIEAVRARMGSKVEVTLGALQIRQAGTVAGSTAIVAPLTAVPDAGARTGGFIRFVIYDGRSRASTSTTSTARMLGKRLGVADAEVFVAAEQVKARRAIASGATIAADDLETLSEDVGRTMLKPLPDSRFAIGSKALRSIAPGERVTTTMIVAPALVKSGDQVQTVVRVGSLEAHGVAVATQTGSLGEEIRLVNTSSRRTLRGRVIGAREVEVMHEH